ncbi:ImmA/IrrE family metallo-endopeptidase [Planktothrix sp. FACHB-1355]|uniref:ImmA/IrrE family metallo-endopeptidase n=1 Tax=Aerosakkonema funiforme FACHB-1375 TaxID=2949571 RepID=A0A926ZKD8_9CYAN|nr:ImmA/IrrE family metallo-endopeptidase [Aerosakkonema funiforme]MBD2183906.1 ImmA/IrrE family metallo-endopeptidase [Aerosakkonema funiforme FACHB-1375]MBD3562398.1 ImmA/IrrE family metallo-endopeptidase [Planktothrix sp. FACHB-1355]
MREVPPAAQPYRHPGEAFLARYGAVRSEEDVWRYVEFLRSESGLSDAPPIDLECIYRHFGIPTPLRAPLDEQQGILVDSRTGIILIKENDPIVRQRFTEGHELMELLFDAQEQGRFCPNWSGDRKERLCDRGAADLLMPESSFLPRMKDLGISLASGRSLAKLYQTSLLATLVRMMQQGSGNYALVMWHCALKPKEVKGLSGLSSLLPQPQKKLRVWWRTQTKDWHGGFIPKDKSIPHNSLISYAYVSGQPYNGMEMIHLGWGFINCFVEAMPIQIGDKYCVLSLLRLTEI